jgi:zinc D-Ala-D-Ala carboxypeptidase
MTDWPSYQNFTSGEFACRCGCGQSPMDDGFMSWLQAIRTVWGRPMTITSGYRCPKHPVEAKKARPGAHASGKAVDIAVANGQEAHALVKLAMAMDVLGLAIKLSDGQRFIHLDMMDSRAEAPRPACWEY